MKKMRSFRKIVMSCLMGCIILVVSIVLISHSGSQATVLAEASPSSSPGLRLIKSDEESIVLELFTPAYKVNEKVVDNVTYHLLSVADYAETGEVSKPQLPLKGVMLGIPAEAEVTLNVLESDVTISAEHYDLYSVPRPIVERDLEGGIRYVGLEFTKDESFYSTDDFYPADITEIASTGFIRSQRFVQLRLYPFQYNPFTGELRHYHLIRIELKFSYEDRRPAVAARGVGEVDSFEQILKSTVLNYDSARKWRVQPRSIASQATAFAQAPSYKISVDEDGIYQVTYADLQVAGVEVDSLDPRTFQLHNQGEEVAIYVAGEGDGSFDPGDYILFYGQKMDTKYTDVNVYWLTWGSANGLRMPAIDGTPSGMATVPEHFLTTHHKEEDIYYVSGYPSGPEYDRWVWNSVYANGSPASRSYTTTLQHIATAPLSATVRGLFRGYSADLQHYTRVYLNGHLIDDHTWPPQTEYEFEANVPQSYLVEATNTISVECPLGGGATLDAVFVNWFEIDYHATYTAEEDSLFFAGDEAGTWEYHIEGFMASDIEVFDVTAPTNPTRILSATVEAGGTYTLTFEHTISGEHHYLALTPARRSSPLSIEEDSTSDLRSNANGADYIIITHSDFYTDVLPLANHRAAQGLRSMVVDVEDVYDEFSYGIFDPMAIHDFLAYVYANWVLPAPAYVLLVGDGNYDFKDNFDRGEPNYIPPYLADVDPWIGEIASDNRYVCVSGDDILPDMHIGRLPAQTSAQASTMVNKILDYERDSPSSDWNKDILFLADNADAAGDFAALSDDIADNYLPSSYTAQKVYYKITHPTVDGVRTAVIDALNEGRLLVNYIGHASNQFWANEKLFQLSSIAALTNAERLPLMVPMTCLEGYFTHPSPSDFDLSSLGESIVRAPAGGAIASWSPTGLGLATGHDYLGKGFFTAVFTDNIAEIGTATYLGKLKLYTETGGEASPYRDLMDTYVLFGDPFMKLNLPACDAADYDNDGRITVGDVMQVAAHWDTEWGDANFDRKYDLDDDGDVDIVDVMWVAGRWEEVC